MHKNRHLSSFFLQVSRFGIIGISASAWHFFAVYMLVSWLKILPLIANIFAFISAFVISYLGHSMWTFKEKEHQHNTTIKKFFMVALFGFAINESGYFILLSYSSLSYLNALLIVLIIVPIITFILSKYWAFN